MSGETIRPETGELCAFSGKYGEHVPALAVFIGWDTDGNRKIVCIPTCPKPADRTETNAAAA
jgi:hypothetical protein